MKKIRFIIGVILIITTMEMLSANVTKAQANEVTANNSQIIIAEDNVTLNKVKGDAENFLTVGNDVEKGLLKADDERAAVNNLYNICLAIGTVVAVVTWAVMGVRFITQGINGKAKIKELLIPVAVGTAVLFGALGIWKIVLNINHKVFKDSTIQYSKIQVVTSHINS